MPSIHRRDFLRKAAGASLLSLLPARGAEIDAPKRNVLFLMADDLRCDLGCYGATGARTPNIDRLARRGVTLDRAYCQFPVCNPSRASMLTGLRPETLRVLTNANEDAFRLKRPDVVTLPQLFRQNGWYTASVGKIIHVGVNEKGQEAAAQDPPSWDFCREYGAPELQAAGTGADYTLKLRGGEHQPDWLRWVSVEGSPLLGDVQTANHAIQLLEQNHDRPFFIAAGFHKPHDPYFAPGKYFDLHPPDVLRLPQEPADRSPVPPFATPANDLFKDLPDADRLALLRAYRASASFMDAQLGTVLDAMDRLKLWDNTIVVLLADHGYMHWEHGWWAKPTAYEPCARVPCIVWAPGLPGMGRHAAGIVESLDLYPTIAELAGLRPPAAIEGRSFVPQLHDPSARGKDAAYTLMWGDRGRIQAHSVRTDRWRYTEFSDHTAALYDHTNDPGEFYNLAQAPAHKDICAQLSQLLRKS